MMHYWQGKLNSCAGALSHEASQTDKAMVAMVEIPQIQAKDGDLAEIEQRCTIGTNRVHYLKDQVLPPLEKEVKELTLT